MFILIDKRVFLKQCSQFFSVRYGLVDIDLFLTTLFDGIRGDMYDRDHILGMAYGNRWKNPNEYTSDQKRLLNRFMFTIRQCIISSIRNSQPNTHLHFKYIPDRSSSMSICFRIV